MGRQGKPCRKANKVKMWLQWLNRVGTMWILMFENWEKTGDQASMGVGMREGARKEEEWRL